MEEFDLMTMIYLIALSVTNRFKPTLYSEESSYLTAQTDITCVEALRVIIISQ